MQNPDRRQPKDAHPCNVLLQGTVLKCQPRGAFLRLVDAKDAKLSFEDALGKLESIVESMESGEVSLAELLARFEEGTHLLKVCEARLKDAELKIEQLKKTKDASVVFEKLAFDRET